MAHGKKEAYKMINAGSVNTFEVFKNVLHQVVLNKNTDQMDV